jgi:hypothetical protein
MELNENRLWNEICSYLTVADIIQLRSTTSEMNLICFEEARFEPIDKLGHKYHLDCRCIIRDYDFDLSIGIVCVGIYKRVWGSDDGNVTFWGVGLENPRGFSSEYGLFNDSRKFTPYSMKFEGLSNYIQKLRDAKQQKDGVVPHIS